MSKVPAILRNKLLQMALGAAAGAGTWLAVDQPSQSVQLAMEIGAHYESSGRHIGKPYIDRNGRGQPLTVCNGVTGSEVVAGRYYSEQDCRRLELVKYRAAEREAARLFRHWGSYNVWVQASFIDMLYNLGGANVQSSTMLRLANAGQLVAACQQMPRWVYGTRNGVQVKLAGLVDRRSSTAELCAQWGRNGHFSAPQAAPTAQVQP